MSLDSKVKYHGPCSSRGPQPAHPLAQHASSSPHLDFLRCYRFPVERPCFRLMVAEVLAEDGCRCGARGASSYRDFCSLRHQFGHMRLTQVPACDRWDMSNSGS